MLSKRTVIGMIVGCIIMGIGGASLLIHIGPITIDEDHVLAAGDSARYAIPAPAGTPQHMEIRGDSFDLRLESPGAGLQIPEGESEDGFESFRDRADEPLVLDWTHPEDGETEILVRNTGSSELAITGQVIRSSDPIWFTFDIMVITSGMVIIGFSMGFTLRKPKGF